jgi:hypothetical protein
MNEHGARHPKKTADFADATDGAKRLGMRRRRCALCEPRYVHLLILTTHGRAIRDIPCHPRFGQDQAAKPQF